MDPNMDPTMGVCPGSLKRLLAGVLTLLAWGETTAQGGPGEVPPPLCTNGQVAVQVNLNTDNCKPLP